MAPFKPEESSNIKDATPEAIKKANSELVSTIKTKLEKISSLKSIFRVPEEIRRAHEEDFQDLYNPLKVSIGPIHYPLRHEKLKEMEEQKWHYMYTLLSRKPDLEASLHECVKALKETEKTARNYYAEDTFLESNEFVEMMLLDGCFIIELFLKYFVKGLRLRGDPIFTTKGGLSSVRCDLILLENQMPLVILQRLSEIVPIPIQCRQQSLSELAFRFFRNMLPGDKEFLSEKFNQEGNHLLDLIRHCYLPTYAREQSEKATPPKDDGSYSVTKLLKNGVKFMRFTARSMLDIMFDNGLVEIAPLQMHKFTKKLFANLIALEQHETHVQHFTCYVLLMRALIRDDKDEKVFRHLRILIDDKDNKENFWKLFEKLCKGVSVKEFYYAGMLQKIDNYRRNRKPWMQILTCGCSTIST